ALPAPSGTGPVRLDAATEPPDSSMKGSRKPLSLIYMPTLTHADTEVHENPDCSDVSSATASDGKPAVAECHRLSRSQKRPNPARPRHTFAEGHAMYTAGPRLSPV